MSHWGAYDQPSPRPQAPQPWNSRPGAGGNTSPHNQGHHHVIGASMHQVAVSPDMGGGGYSQVDVGGLPGKRDHQQEIHAGAGPGFAPVADDGELYDDWKAIVEQRRDQQNARFHSDIKSTVKSVRLLEQLVDPDGKEAAAAVGRGSEHRAVHEELRDIRIENSELQLAIDQISRKLLTGAEAHQKNPSAFVVYEGGGAVSTETLVEGLPSINVDLALAIRREENSGNDESFYSAEYEPTSKTSAVPTSLSSSFTTPGPNNTPAVGGARKRLAPELPRRPPKLTSREDEDGDLRGERTTRGRHDPYNCYDETPSTTMRAAPGADDDPNDPQHLAKLAREWADYNCTLQQELTAKRRLLAGGTPPPGSTTSFFGRDFSQPTTPWSSTAPGREDPASAHHKKFNTNSNLSLIDAQGIIVPLVIPTSLPEGEDAWQRWKDELLTETECRGSSEDREAWIGSIIYKLDALIELELQELLDSCSPADVVSPGSPETAKLLAEAEMPSPGDPTQQQAGAVKGTAGGGLRRQTAFNMSNPVARKRAESRVSEGSPGKTALQAYQQELNFLRNAGH